jgi:hypothetical protein
VIDAPSTHWIDLVGIIELGLAPNSTDEERKADKQFPLISLEEKYRQHKNYGRIMAALVDLKLTFHFFANDFSYAGGVFNEQLHEKVLAGRTEAQIVASKILFLRYLNAFVLRCRSFWDKAMGLMVLALNQDEYENFLSSHSRRAAFKKAMQNHLAEESVASIDTLIGVLDDKFRTAEAHQTGTLRTWIFHKWDPNPINTPFGYLLGIYNHTFKYAEQISKLLLENRIIPSAREHS